MQYFQSSSHLYSTLHPDLRANTIQWCVDQLTPHTDKFDAIAVCGASGMLIGSVVADKLGKNIILVRKKSDKNHSAYKVEGPKDGRYLVLDDLIETTLKNYDSYMLREMIKDVDVFSNKITNIFLNFSCLYLVTCK